MKTGFLVYFSPFHPIIITAYYNLINRNLYHFSTFKMQGYKNIDRFTVMNLTENKNVSPEYVYMIPRIIENPSQFQAVIFLKLIHIFHLI